MEHLRVAPDVVSDSDATAGSAFTRRSICRRCAVSGAGLRLRSEPRAKRGMSVARRTSASAFA